MPTTVSNAQRPRITRGQIKINMSANHTAVPVYLPSAYP
ncbi:MAG: hypothetical protein CHACPFDD_01366 [Phycisphaerae bacterium]|nr:hypothetical protein [Phycisphaerae bacterium]